MSFTEKKYYVDGEPASADDIINLAKELDEEYANSSLHQTSVAAAILRKNGYEVGEL